MQHTATNPALDLSAGAKSQAGHPTGLRVLFFTEMWERFSYYGMRAILVLYLVKALGYQEKDALALYGTYTGLVYLTPILGGYIADRWLGMRNALLIGSITMMLGHFAMAFESTLHLALGLLIIGNGFFKPNTSTMVGKIYPENDPRIPGAYTIFYMGINLGAFFAPLVVGTLGESEQFGWHWGFASAGVGMAIGTIVFVLGQSTLGNAGFRPGQTSVDKRDWAQISIISLAMIPLVYAVMALWGQISGVLSGLSWQVNTLFGLALLAAVIYAPSLFSKAEQNAVPLTGQEWRRILVLFTVMLFVVFFWMGFEQAGGSMSLFADQKTERFMLGWEIPASWFQSINPFVIVALAPVLAIVWQRIKLSDIAKQAGGLIVLGLGFVVMAIAAEQAQVFGKVGPQWLAIVFFIHTLGELMLSPIGLCLVSRLAPLRFASMLMGMWFLSTAIANKIAGSLDAMLEGSGMPLFWFLAVAAAGAGVLLLLLSPLLNRWAGEQAK